MWDAAAAVARDAQLRRRAAGGTVIETNLRLDDFLAGREILAPADLTNLATEESRADDLTLEEIAANFRQSRAAALERLDGLELADFARSALHPRLKTPMTLVDLMAFVAEHDDHHLARIRELKRLLRV